MGISQKEQREKKRKRLASRHKPQGAAAVDANLFTGGTGGSKGVGKVEIAESVSLAKVATGDPSTVNVRITRDSDSFSPNERAAERKANAGEPQLAKGLAAIAASVPSTGGKVSAAISGGLTGAALGATVGEEIDRGRKAKSKKKSKRDSKS